MLKTLSLCRKSKDLLAFRRWGYPLLGLALVMSTPLWAVQEITLVAPASLTHVDIKVTDDNGRTSNDINKRFKLKTEGWACGALDQDQHIADLAKLRDLGQRVARYHKNIIGLKQLQQNFNASGELNPRLIAAAQERILQQSLSRIRGFAELQMRPFSDAKITPEHVARFFKLDLNKSFSFSARRPTGFSSVSLMDNGTTRKMTIAPCYTVNSLTRLMGKIKAAASSLLEISEKAEKAS